MKRIGVLPISLGLLMTVGSFTVERAYQGKTTSRPSAAWIRCRDSIWWQQAEHCFPQHSESLREHRHRYPMPLDIQFIMETATGKTG